MTSHDDDARDVVRDSSAGGARLQMRVAELETQMDALRAEVAELRAELSVPRGPHVSPSLAAKLRQPPPSSSTDATSADLRPRGRASAAISGAALESIVGRYGTLVLAAVVILMAVGALIKMAVANGLLTPDVRVAAGILAACAAALGGLYFRRRGDVRYGSVLLAIALAIVDLVAWGAGPRLHLVPTGVAIAVVDVAAIALAALSLVDQSEFLFVIAVAGALSAPFVTSTGGGTALALLLYGGAVLAGSLRSVRDTAWPRAFAVLCIGAIVYAAGAADLPVSTTWYGPYLIALFSASCAVAALVGGQKAWRSELPRAFLSVALIGESIRWKITTHPDIPVPVIVGLAFAAVTYASLLVRGVPARFWTASALLLPCLSLSMALSGMTTRAEEASVTALWAILAFVVSRMERAAGDHTRSGAHLLTGSVLGSLAIGTLLWEQPLALVSGLAVWGIVMAFVCKDETAPLPLAGVALAVGGAALSAFDQLMSRGAFTYTPFATRSSASALAASLGIGLAGGALSRGTGAARKIADRPVRLGMLVGFLIVWGRMEVADAFNADLASFLLTSYYAACGVASIVAGRRLGIGRLRAAGLGLALFAAFKAVVEVTDISSVLLRVGAYAAVGVFLLGAGFLYRESGGEG
jgi:uncharacterized membrane protein